MNADSSNPSALPQVTQLRLKDLLSGDEIRALTARSDAWGAWTVLSTWASIAAAFAVLAAWPNALTFLLAVLFLGGRQLALAVLAHEAAHRTLFKSPRLNDFFGDWAGARPILTDVPRYREHHLRHHTNTGIEGDPDTSLVTPFPTTRRSMWMKVLRDLTGQTGLRRMAAQFLMDIGVFRYTVAAEVERLPQEGRRFSDYARGALRYTAPGVLANLVLFGALWACGAGWTYSAWVVAYLTTFSLYLRIRSIAEHACTERCADMFRNTRTIRANWLDRLTVAPMNVNFHIEHHLMAAVPWYRLRKAHELLRARGASVGSPTYADVMRQATTPLAQA